MSQLPRINIFRRIDLPSLIVVDLSGKETTLEADVGRTVMEVLRENGFDELLALCGGCCSCATCHVYVSPDHLDNLTPITEDESDLLDSSEHRTERSRLSCQLKITTAFDHVRIEIAPED